MRGSKPAGFGKKKFRRAEQNGEGRERAVTEKTTPFLGPVRPHLPDGLRERLKPPTSLELESARLKAADTPDFALTMSSTKSATGCTEPALPHTTASKASPCLRPSGRSLRKPMEMRWS